MPHPDPAGGAGVSLAPLAHHVTIRTDWHWGLLGHVETDRTLHLALQLRHKAVVLVGQGGLASTGV